MSRPPRPAVPDGPYLVLGLGQAGVAAADALSRRVGAASVLAWDGHPTPGSERAAARLREAGGHAELGPWERCGLAREPWRCAIKSPGIAFDAAPLREAARRGARVLDEAELGWRCASWPTLGVTGTNGKTTVSTLVHAALTATGTAAVLAGNTEDAPALSALEPATAFVVAELSSYQLEGCDALRPDVAVLTNLSRDHLDRHRTLEEYAAVKRRLFVRGGTAAPVSVLNVDDPLGRELARDCAAAGGRVVGFGTDAAAHVRVQRAVWDVDGSEIALRVGGERVELATRLPGMHNAYNVAAALAASEALGLDRSAAIAAFERTPGVPGRFERIQAGQPFEAIVDFAHNPDGVRRALEAARAVVGEDGSMRAVLGVNGGIDPGKRPAMARIAREMADHLVLTTGNPRGEAPESVLDDLRRGAGNGDGLETIPDRREAIAAAVAAAAPGDLVIVLGRGAMTRLRQSPAGEGPPFDDREVLREVLGRLTSAA